jgi:hypothetical protein
MKKKALWAAILVLTAVSATVTAYAGVTFFLTPRGRVRVALRSFGDGYARWEPNAPRVFDGSFSVRLNSGTNSGGADGGGIYIGPLSIPLRSLTAARITYWVYHMSTAGATPDQNSPYVNLVLDNGLTLEGVESTPSTGFIYQGTQGFPSADIWVQMSPQDKWYSSFAVPLGDPPPIETRLKGTAVANCDIHTPCPLATWLSVFTTARVIQVQIFFGKWTEVGQSVCVDQVTILGMLVQIEPETIGLTTEL